MIENLFSDISTRLSEKVADLPWIDLDFGQFELSDESPAVVFPCVLVDFQNITYTSENKGNQQGMVDVQLRVGFNLYEDYGIATDVTTPHREIAAQRLALIRKIHTALQGWEQDYFTPLTRVSLQGKKRYDGLKVYTVIYRTAAKDDSAAKEIEELSGVKMVIQKQSAS